MNFYQFYSWKCNQRLPQMVEFHGKMEALSLDLDSFC